MNLLVPLVPNSEMTLLKYNQRLQLSFSETKAVAKLFVEERPDLTDKEGRFCFSDGAGSISEGKALTIRDTLGLDEVPSAFQFRCGPYKGAQTQNYS